MELFCCIAVIVSAIGLQRGFFMDDVIERVLTTFGMMRSVDQGQLAEARPKLESYIGTLTSAGQHDEQRLAVYGLAYMRELHDGPADGASGC
jgi:hypothetical protein